MKITVLYVGSSLLVPLRQAEQDINRQYELGLTVAAHNCGLPLTEDEWQGAERDLIGSEIIFIIHVTEGENALRIGEILDQMSNASRTVIAFNCMPELMRRTRMGRLDFASLMKSRASGSKTGDVESSRNLVKRIGSWMAEQVKGANTKSASSNGGKQNGHAAPRNAGAYLKLVNRLPAILKFVPGAGKLKDIKHYLNLFCYFLQPTPGNIRSMLLYAVKHYSPDGKEVIEPGAFERAPTVAIYHPDADGLFETFEEYRGWYQQVKGRRLDPEKTLGLLLMRPQIVSGSRLHYDGLMRAIEAEGLSIIPAISTFMDNREACREFFLDRGGSEKPSPRVSEILSLTGFSFVGGPAMNDSSAAVEFFKEFNLPYRSMVSLDVQTVESWEASRLGLNPVQTAMQVAIPEIDGATEGFVFGGITESGIQPEPIEDRCARIARRLARWNHLRIAERKDLRLAYILFCFPPNKGNIGTAADLDVFRSLFEILKRLKVEGYDLEIPDSPDHLRGLLLDGNSSDFGSVANIAYRMSVDEYRSFCPYVSEIEDEWGRPPGMINSNGREILIPGLRLGNIFIGVQPTFGYEGDPMRLLAAESGAPHHAFMGLYTYIEKIFRADALIHVGTHGATEFMPGKQVGLSSRCWPDRLIGEMPNIYIYSVNNPSEGTIAKRRSYGELISYLTPPIENAGLYKELISIKDLLTSYRQAVSESEKSQLYEAIEEKARSLNL